MSRRPLLAAGVIAALTLVPLAAPIGAATSATPGDCAVAYPQTDLVAGQTVTGLTVTSGTIPTQFTGTILGVLHDGIAPGVDMIMARLTSTEIDRVGVWQGMSGSPVYIGDQLVGAVAYGLAAGPSTVAGITPAAAMTKYLQAAPARVVLSRAGQEQLTATTAVTADQAASGFAQLRMPVAVAGVSQRVLNRQPARSWLPRDAYAAGTAPAASSASDLVAGGNLGVTMSYGDITMGGIGTVTTVCNGRLVGFGHPMNFMGKATYGLASADAVYIQEDPTFAGFKVANLGEQAGTITDDRLTGVTGTLGAAPPTVDVTVRVAHGTDARTGVSHVQLPQAAATVTYYALEANHDVVLDARQAGSELQTWTLSGTHDGTPFTLTRTDRQRSPWDITEASAMELPTWVDIATSVPGVKLSSVGWTSTVTDDPALLQVSRLEQWRGGNWVVVKRGYPAKGRPGHAITLRVTMSQTGAPPVQSITKVLVPLGAGGREKLYVSGNYIGDSMGGGYVDNVPTTYPALAAQIKALTRQDTYTTMLLPAAIPPDIPVSMLGSLVSKGTSVPQPAVVAGVKRAPVIIRMR